MAARAGGAWIGSAGEGAARGQGVRPKRAAKASGQPLKISHRSHRQPNIEDRTLTDNGVDRDKPLV
jgi:hypothetical protein